MPRVRSWTSWVALGLLPLIACTIESGGEQAPIFQGSGVVIADDGTGRTISVDPGVPFVPTCESGQLLVRGASGWECRFPDASLEADPTVNDLAQATLSCAAGDVAEFDGVDWTCAARISEAEVDALVANNAYATQAALSTLQTAHNTLLADFTTLQTDFTALGAAHATLRSDFDALEVAYNALALDVAPLLDPELFRDTFTRSVLGAPEKPANSGWYKDSAATSTYGVVANHLQQTTAGGGSPCLVAPLYRFVAPTNVRLRFAFRMTAVPTAQRSLLVSFNGSLSGAMCNHGAGLEIIADNSTTDRIRPTGGAAPSSFNTLAEFAASTTYYVQAIVNGLDMEVDICTGAYCANGTIFSQALTTGFGNGSGTGGIAVAFVDDPATMRFEIDEIFLDQL